MDWYSYWYTCQSCDASIEIVSQGLHMQDPVCNCGKSDVIWCQTSVKEYKADVKK